MANNTDILIVGAGPVGLTLASFLSFHGLQYRLIDKNIMGTQTSNAIGVQARTLELLSILGITDPLIKKGNQLKTFHLISNQNKLASWNLNLIDSQYPYILSVSQKLTEEALLDYLANANITIERKTELLSFKQEDDKVNVLLNTPYGEERLSTKYMIACDGYHSTIRTQLNIPYEGSDMPLDMLIMDAPIEGLPESKTNGYAAFTNSLSIILLPLANSWRVIADVAKEPRFHCHHGELPTQDMFQSILDQTCHIKVKIREPHWASKFLVHERIAKQYRVGRTFLLGDAAHAHSPAGAQGMNTGMQDAVNLAWKLAMVLKNQSSSTLLDTYEQERRPVAENIIQFSGLLIRLGTVRNTVLIKIRDMIAQVASKLPFIQKRFAATVSEINVHYRRSCIVQGVGSAKIQPGDRAPSLNANAVTAFHKHILQFVGKSYVLLDFFDNSQSFENPYPAHLKIIKVPQEEKHFIKSYGMIKGGYVLLRPDQYIGFIGQDANALKTYLKNIFI